MPRSTSITRAQKTLINQIEDLRDSNVVTYITGDRQPFGARIAEDVVRVIYDHILNLDGTSPKKSRLDLFIYSRGGDVSVPWRIVSMVREYYKEFNVLIPYKAHSAATLISLGADKIIMGPKAELSPVDPTLTRNGESNIQNGPAEISVEDVSSYVSFIKDRANVNDQQSLASLIGLLSQNLTPLVLGSVNRQYSHIRLVARKLLASHKKKLEEQKLTSIIEALTEKMYSHGHAIGRGEAIEIGLPIEKPSVELEKLMWELFEKYEEELQLRDNIDPETEMQQDGEEKKIDTLTLAIIESKSILHNFETAAIFRKKRNVPPNPQINVNLNLALPPGVSQQQVPPQVQRLSNQLLQSIMQILPGVIQQEITRQSPLIGIEGRSFGGKWVKKQR
jgi:hypothetical protein